MSRERTLNPLEQAKNQKIIQAFLQNDWNVLQQCYEEVYGMIERLVTANGGTIDDARTLILDSFKIFRKQCEKNNFQLTAKFSTYTYAVCRKLWLRKLRDRKQDAMSHVKVMLQRKRSGEDEDSTNDLSQFPEQATDEDVEQALQIQQLHKIVVGMIQSLTERCKKIMLLYGAEKSHREIAKLLKISEGASRKGIHDCKTALANRIKQSVYYRELCDNRAIHAFIKKYVR